MTNQQQLEYQR